MAKLVACHADSYAQSFQSKVVACTPVAGSEHKQTEGAASGGASAAPAGKKGKTDAKVRAQHCTLEHSTPSRRDVTWWRWRGRKRALAARAK